MAEEEEVEEKLKLYFEETEVPFLSRMRVERDLMIGFQNKNWASKDVEDWWEKEPAIGQYRK